VLNEAYFHLLTATIDSEQDGVFIVRLRGENPLTPPVLYANPAFSRITGYTQDDLANGVYPRIFGEFTNIRDVEERSRDVLSGRAVVTEVELARKDGSRFWAEVRAHPLESPAIHCALSIHDVTERRRNQEAMQLLSEAISQASDFMLVTDATSIAEGGPRIVYANRAFLDATGFTEAELIGQPYLCIYSSKNTQLLMRSIRNAIEDGKTSNREVLAQRKDGGEFWIEAVERPFLTRHGRKLRLLVGRDITHRRRSTTQLSLLYTAAEQALTPIIIYEFDNQGYPLVSYENEIAAVRGRYELVTIWARDDEAAAAMRERLARGDEVVLTYKEPGETVYFVARAIRSDARIEAVLTQERIGAGKDER
jgi:PAS domain S-box-containing protein